MLTRLTWRQKSGSTIGRATTPGCFAECSGRKPKPRIAIQLGKIRADAEIAESLYNRARGMSLPAVKIFQGTPEAGPVIVPHQEHLPPDVGAAKLWLSRRQPERWKERQEVDFSGTLEHRLNQMTPEERAADAVELMARVKRRLAEYQQTIEHVPQAEAPEDE